jgi:thioredoxin 1
VDEVSSATFADDVLASAVPVVVDFWAPWCRPCDAIEPHLRALEEQWAGRTRFVRLNVDENAGVASRYGVLALPTVILFVGGEPRVTINGAHRRERYERELGTEL